MSRTLFRFDSLSRRCTTAGTLCFLFASLGCGAQPAAPKASVDKPTSTAKKPAAEKSSGGHADSKVTEQDGRKFLDGIPYDVWFDDPLAIVSNTTNVAPVGSAPVSTTPAPTADKPAHQPAEKPSVPAASADWSAYIAMDQLQDESKRVRNQLKAMLQTPAAFSADFEVVKMDGAVMAALAIIVSESGDGVNWKPNAGYIRDYGFEIFDAAKGPAKPHYDKTAAAFENLQSVFDGSIPAGAPQPAATRPYSEVASRYYVMRRMKLAFEALKLNINTEAKLKSEQDAALLEAMMLAAMSKVVSSKDYSSADEPEYQAFMQEILTNCQAATTAIMEQQFEAFSTAMNAIDVTCKNCHSQYKD